MKVQINLFKHRYALCLVVFLFTLLPINKTYAQWQGSGTQASPYLIYTPSDMQLIATNVFYSGLSYDGVYFKLMNDLDFSSYNDTNTIQIGEWPNPFEGKFDGNYKIIRNISIYRIYTFIDNAGIFGYTYPGFELRNLGLENASVTGGVCTGLMCGRNLGIIENCYAKGDVSSNGSNQLGGFCGKNDGLINNCYAIANVTMNTISSSSFVGGFVGKNGEGRQITNCYSVSTVNGNNGNNFSGFSTNESLYGDLCSKNYYNNNWSIATNCTSSSANLIGISRTISQMRSLAFVDSLNNNTTTPAYSFSPDTLINGGFPIFNWQLRNFIRTDSAINVDFSTATLKGFTTDSAQNYTILGFQYREVGTDTLFTTNSVITSDSTFEINITNLLYNKEYEFRSFGYLSGEIGYGNFLSFRTRNVEAITLPVTDLLPTSAKLNGIIIHGPFQVISSGFEWKKKSDSFYNIISIPGDTLYYYLTGLDPETEYVYRAFLSNEFGTFRGEELEFTTRNAGLNDQEINKISFLIYPNPAENNTNILIKGVSLQTEIGIYDVGGRRIKVETINPINNQVNSTIDVSNLSKGIYFVKVSNSSFNKIEKLIVK